TNTLSRKKEVFKPLKNKTVKLYVCGVTPYDYSHIGHGRCYVNFDVLFRFLQLMGYKVKYTRNLTDIDDKILNKAKEEYGDQTKYEEIAKKFTKFFHQDMQALNCLPPTYEPTVTQNIPEIIQFIEKLIEKKHAYVIDNDVYFDVLSFPEYGKLSGKKLEGLKTGARVEINSRKKHPADFVLWKGNKDNLFWKSPWGYGRPGWHIECSVLASKYLGSSIDIHGGGIDLIFPHHENEIAQSESLYNQKFVNTWIHNAFVNINKEKMSKSLGNFFTLKTIFETINPMVLRFFFLQHHYKTPIEFNLKDTKAAQVAYKKLIMALDPNEKINHEFSLLEYRKYPIIEQMIHSLCDDLNTPKVLGEVFGNLNEIRKNLQLRKMIKAFLKQALGLTCESIEEKREITPKIEELIKKREQARKEKNWQVADEIRDKLKQLGYEIKDAKTK
ncbi:cysteine--tRNA ligase, partial [Candidatus Dependentiae bacterium]|nr:cysteine--tRNA ligase [Candidatus Dependentiae bacterium]